METPLDARLAREALDRLQARYAFYVWDERAAHPEARWMTAFDTTPEDVDRFADAVRWAVAGAPAGSLSGA